MSSIRTLVVAIGLLLGVGLFGAPSAAATALCAANEETCSAENTYGVPADVQLALSSETESLFDAVLDVKCAVSALAGEASEESGSLLVGQVTSLTFSECEGCTAVAQKLPYKAEVEATGSGDGMLTISSGGSGNPRVLVTCAGIECTFGAASIKLAADGGEPGTVLAQEEELKRESGSIFCGSTSKWSASYEVTSSESNHVVNAGEPTILCKSAPTKDGSGELICKKGDRFLGETEGALKLSTKVKFTDVGEPKNVIECTESKIKGAFNPNGSSAIGGGFKELSFNSGGGGKCTSTIPNNATVELKAENAPWDNSKISYLQAEPKPQGTLSIRKRKAETRLQLKVGASTCSYKPVELFGTVTNPEGATPMIFEVPSLWKIVAVTAPCPQEMGGTIEWSFTQKGGAFLWVSEKEAK